MGASSRVAMAIVPHTYGFGVCGAFARFTHLSLSTSTSPTTLGVRPRLLSRPFQVDEDADMEEANAIAIQEALEELDALEVPEEDLDLSPELDEIRAAEILEEAEGENDPFEVIDLDAMEQDHSPAGPALGSLGGLDGQVSNGGSGSNDSGSSNHRSEPYRRHPTGAAASRRVAPGGAAASSSANIPSSGGGAASSSVAARAAGRAIKVTLPVGPTKTTPPVAEIADTPLGAVLESLLPNSTDQARNKITITSAFPPEHISAENVWLPVRTFPALYPGGGTIRVVDRQRADADLAQASSSWRRGATGAGGARGRWEPVDDYSEDEDHYSDEEDEDDMVAVRVFLPSGDEDVHEGRSH